MCVQICQEESRVRCVSRYVVFDVETPNAMNHRMSAIGITVIENGGIVDEFYSLVNPETHFDSFNVQLTRNARSYSASLDNMGAVITVFEY